MATWEYHAVAVYDDINALNALMKSWSDLGWELVQCTASVTQNVAGKYTNQLVNRTVYTLFWRRQIASEYQPQRRA
jgi:hypothetical protein